MDLVSSAVAFLIGVFSGVFAGAFGIGGALAATPLFRILLGVPGKVALGTPLPLVLPAAFTALYLFREKNLVDYKLAITIGIIGTIFAVLGAVFTLEYSGKEMMYFTSVALVASAFVLVRDRPGAVGLSYEDSLVKRIAKILFIGGISGFVSGFLGIGGGFILAPLLVVLFDLPVHSAIATSLAAMVIFFIPGSIVHFELGHIDLQLLAIVFVGSAAGAAIGAREAVEASEERLKKWVAGLLLVLGLGLAAYEILY